MTIRIPRSCGSGSWDSCGSLPAQRPSLVAAVENLGTFSSFTRQDRAAQHKALPESAPHVPFAMPTEITCLEVIGSGSQGVVFKGEAIPKWHLLLPPPPHTTTTTTTTYHHHYHHYLASRQQPTHSPRMDPHNLPHNASFQAHTFV